MGGGVCGADLLRLISLLPVQQRRCGQRRASYILDARSLCFGDCHHRNTFTVQSSEAMHISNGMNREQSESERASERNARNVNRNETSINKFIAIAPSQPPPPRNSASLFGTFAAFAVSGAIQVHAHGAHRQPKHTSHELHFHLHNFTLCAIFQPKEKPRHQALCQLVQDTEFEQFSS